MHSIFTKKNLSESRTNNSEDFKPQSQYWRVPIPAGQNPVTAKDHDVEELLRSSGEGYHPSPAAGLTTCGILLLLVLTNPKPSSDG